MKNLWVILFVIPLFAQKEYDITHITEKNGLYIKKFSDEKVNGEVFQMFGDMKAPLGKMKDGKMDGLWTWWYENGQKKEEGTYKNGKEDGLSTLWYENGQKKSEVTYKDGKRDGLWTEWFENGQKSGEITLKDGKADGLFTLWYENGSKKSEKKYKDDLITSEVEWSEDGKLSSEKEPQQKFIPYDDPPVALSPIRPKYSEIAQAAGIEGTVVVQVFVNEKGRVTETVILKGIPDSGLDEAAIEAIVKVKYRPAKAKGKKVGVWISIPVVFRL